MKRLIVWVAVSLAALWLVIPTSDIVAPRWTVLVTDPAGRPIAGAEVTMNSQQYTVERHDVQVTRITGADGLANFDGRRVRAIGLMRLVGVIRNLEQGAHASFGVHTNVYASKPGYGDPSELKLFSENERASRANGREQQSSHIVLLKCASGYSGIGCSFPDDLSKPILPLKR